MSVIKCKVCNNTIYDLSEVNKHSLKLSTCSTCWDKYHPIKVIRLKAGLKQKDFADSIGVTQGTLSKIESHALNPCLDSLAAIKKGYKQNLNRLIGDIIHSRTVTANKHTVGDLDE